MNGNADGLPAFTPPRGSGVSIQSGKRLLRPLALLLAATGLLVAGCQTKTDTTAESNADVAGTYTLKSVNGQAVPTRVPHGNDSVDVRSGTFVIGADGTCQTETVFARPGGAPASRKVRATYTRQGPTLSMKWEGAGRTTGTVSDRTFTMNNEGMVFEYVRP